MKKKVLLSIVLLVIIFLVATIVVFKMVNTHKENDGGDPISTLPQVELNSKQYINQLEKINIKGTNDTFIITKNVNFEGLYGSFAIAIPYTFVVNGIEYNGLYIINSNKEKDSVTDKNPKYNIKIGRIKDDYKTEILITSK